MSKGNEILEKSINELWSKIVDLRKVYCDVEDEEQEYYYIGKTDFRPYRSMVFTYFNLINTYISTSSNLDMTRKPLLENVLKNLDKELDEISLLSDILISHLDNTSNGKFYCAEVYRCLQDVNVEIIKFSEKVERIIEK